MKRLTERDEFGNAGIIGVASEELQGGLPFEQFNRVTAALNRLAAYEDAGLIPEHAAELYQAGRDGRLMVLPCKVGDTIYVIPSSVKYALNLVNGHEKENRVYKQKVIEIRFFADDYLITTYDGMYSVLGCFFGDTWFFSNEEAEEALKKRKET